MRKSRLYLTLSILSLGVAVFFAAAKGNCRHADFCHVLESPIAVEHRAGVYEALAARDFDRMSMHADELMNGDRIDAYRLKGYALRGMGAHALAINAYSECLRQTDRPSRSDMPLLCDAFMGRAASYAALGKLEAAGADADAAVRIATSLLRRQEGKPWAHYQLACAYAIHAHVYGGSDERDLAVRQLKLAIDYGFNAWEHMAADLDLDSLRDHPEFGTLGVSR